jgi:hypothetical protein
MFLPHEADKVICQRFHLAILQPMFGDLRCALVESVARILDSVWLQQSRIVIIFSNTRLGHYQCISERREDTWQ